MVVVDNKRKPRTFQIRIAIVGLSEIQRCTATRFFEVAAFIGIDPYTRKIYTRYYIIQYVSYEKTTTPSYSVIFPFAFSHSTFQIFRENFMIYFCHIMTTKLLIFHQNIHIFLLIKVKSMKLSGFYSLWGCYEQRIKLWLHVFIYIGVYIWIRVYIDWLFVVI